MKLMTNNSDVCVMFSENIGKNWVVFLDRDGVIIEEKHLLTNIADCQVYPQAMEAIRQLNLAHIPVIMATNQTVVARGLVGEEFIQQTHEHIREILKQANCYLDGIAYCLHSEHADIRAYRLDCPWRKPNSGMFTDIARWLNLELGQCWGVGDKYRDCLAYQDACMHDALVLTGYAGKDMKWNKAPEKTFNDLAQFSSYIIDAL